MSNAVTTKTQPRHYQVIDYIKAHKEDFRYGPVDKERFTKSVSSALLKDPKIAEASLESIVLEVNKACADGLVLDGREAALTRFNVKRGDQWVTEVVYIPMVAGIMKRVRNSGEIASWSVELVYQKEYEGGRFRYKAAPDPMIDHEPIIVGDRGPVVAAYSAVRLRDGSYHYEVMTKDQLDAIRARTKSKTKDGRVVGPWASDLEEMYRKTVIRRHAKRLPVASELIGVTQRVDALYDEGVADIEDVPTDITPRKSAADIFKEMEEEAPKPAAKAKPKPTAKPEPESAPEHDEDGVILEGEVIDDDEIDPEAEY